MSDRWVTIETGSGRAVRAYLAAPPQGSGPGLLICHGSAGLDVAVVDLWATEGYVVIAPDLSAPDGDGAQLVSAAVERLRGHPACKGKIGVLGENMGTVPALQAVRQNLISCTVLVDPPDASASAHLLGAAGRPAVIHAATPIEAAVPSVRTFAYPDGIKAAAAGMAHSRTLALFRQELGPQFDLDALWETHRAHEFITRDADATMRTMVSEPYVNHVPTMTGGFGQIDLHRFYRDHFIPNNPKDMRNIPISRTVGADRVVNEGILCFTHDTEIDWLLPGVPPTGKYVEVALIGIITFRGDKLIHEHIYWDQASVLVQIGLLDPTNLPVAGAAAARKVMDPSQPSNELLKRWREKPRSNLRAGEPIT